MALAMQKSMSVSRPARLNVQAKAAVKTTTKGKTSTKSAAMVCLDCGYLYDGKIAFDDLPNSYACPVCNADKKRFRAFAGSTPRSNDPKTMLNRKTALREQLAAAGEDGSDSSFLALTVGLAVASAAGYFFLKGGF